MATDKQLALSNFIKNIHQQLRDDTKMLGSEEAWRKHCKNETQLQLYSEAMKDLAINYWDHNICGRTNEVSRILWTRNICVDYFWNNRLEYHRNREKDVAQKIGIILKEYKELNDYQHKQMKMLDVGSCYNPFAVYAEYFDVFPIDLAPATPDVFKCDFLKVNVGTDLDTNLDEVFQLKYDSFHIIVFSLLLEYLPTPELRLLCCQKAYTLLKTEGLLVIITPDSKHAGANAKLMKSWKFLLAQLGFLRVCYLKLQHLHCMAFRKSISPKTTARWADLHMCDDLYDKMYIPQDFNSKEPAVSSLLNSEEKESYELEYLPYFIDINDLL